LTSGAAKALWAKTYLFRANFPTALSLCQQVINSSQYSLFSSYYGIFKDAGENCSESILEWQNYNGPNKTDDHGSWYATCQGVRAANSTGWNLGWGWNVPTDAFVNSFEAGDTPSFTVLFPGNLMILQRWLWCTLPASPAVLPQKYWNKKVYADPAVRQSTGS
jgi:hypothetical protein